MYIQSYFSPINKSKIFSCIHQNIKSIRKNFNLFLVYLHNLNIIDDVIIEPETWIVFDNPILEFQYTKLILIVTKLIGHDGISIYVHNRITIKPVNCNMFTADVLLQQYLILNNLV